jgi:heme-degrading monooxygenase HmoA
LIRASTGNVDGFLLEHATESDRVIACTMWQTEDDAARYEASGSAKEVVDRVRHFFAGPPSLASYHVRRNER